MSQGSGSSMAAVDNILDKLTSSTDDFEFEGGYDEGIIGAITLAPTPVLIDAEELHEEDAYAAVFLNVVLIVCVLLAYYIKQHRIYYMPESAAAMIVGVLLGAFVRYFLTDLTMYQFSPEFFFFCLLPPIIFEAGYSLEKKEFFRNLGAIALYAFGGTIISTFIVGSLTFYFAQQGWITGISTTNRMESLLFGALISAVDPVATLSIMNNPELECNRLLYTLVFGESVLNDAVAVVLFKTFRKYYDEDAPDLTAGMIPKILLDFSSMTILSILVGIGLGLMTSFIYKHTNLRKFSNLESTLLFLCCYFCYATAEALELSGIMAIFFNGVVISHYNSYNLSDDARHATEHIFETLATVSETIVFLYMGMGVFTDKFSNWSLSFSLFAMLFCVLGRFCNIFPLSYLANLNRKKDASRIGCNMQIVLWFAGLRGAIAYALAENMPGQNRETYISGTLVICFITTVFCGGCTESLLTTMNMKDKKSANANDAEEEVENLIVSTSLIVEFDEFVAHQGFKRWLVDIDRNILMVYFGGAKKRNAVRGIELATIDESMSILSDNNDDDDNDDEFALKKTMRMSLSTPK